jgi:hypothetical protein
LKRYQQAMATRFINQKILVILPIIFGMTIIIASNIDGHFHPPWSILLTPIWLSIIFGIVNKSLYKINYRNKIIYNFGLLLLNDLLIRKYSGGMHDDEGKIWISSFFIVSVFLANIIMTISAFSAKTQLNNVIDVKFTTKNNLLMLLLLNVSTLMIYFLFISTL